jgi:hypothetical protein
LKKRWKKYFKDNRGESTAFASSGKAILQRSSKCGGHGGECVVMCLATTLEQSEPGSSREQIRDGQKRFLRRGSLRTLALPE